MPKHKQRNPGQQALMSVARQVDHKEFGSIIQDASIDDLEWFLDMLNLQIEETPHWIEDPDVLHKILAWDRRLRSFVTEVLHNKRVANRPRAWLVKAGDKLLFVALGAVFALVIRSWFE